MLLSMPMWCWRRRVKEQRKGEHRFVGRSRM